MERVKQLQHFTNLYSNSNPTEIRKSYDRIMDVIDAKNNDIDGVLDNINKSVEIIEENKKIYNYLRMK